MERRGRMKIICSKVAYRWDLCPLYTCHIRCDTPKQQSLVLVSTFKLPWHGAEILLWLQLQLCRVCHVHVSSCRDWAAALKKSSCIDDDALQVIPCLEGVMWPMEFCSDCLTPPQILTSPHQSLQLCCWYRWWVGLSVSIRVPAWKNRWSFELFWMACSIFHKCPNLNWSCSLYCFTQAPTSKSEGYIDIKCIY